MNLSFEFISLIYRIFWSSCKFFCLTNNDLLLVSPKKLQSEPKSPCISLENKPETQVMKHFSLAFITGASSGIGEACATLFADRGIPLILSGTNQERLEGVANECRKKVAVEIFLADLSTPEGRSLAISKIWNRCPDLIINCAGFGFYGNALSFPTSSMSQMVDVNCKAVMELTLEGARALVANKKKGVILNVSSAAAFQVLPYFTVYAATKTFVNSISQAFDFEFSPLGVRVLASCPGVVQTRFQERAAKGRRPADVPFKMTKEFAAKQIWMQIEKEKPIHLFDWRYRILTVLSKLLPKKILFSQFKKLMAKRAANPQ
jgi:short-subunit dehydrogenase